MNEQARGQLEKEIEKQTRELERFQQDAQAELNDIQVELNDGFQKKLFPVLQKMAEEKGLHLLFSAADAGLIWADEGLNLTEEAVKRLDGGVEVAIAPSDRTSDYVQFRAARPSARSPSAEAAFPPHRTPARTTVLRGRPLLSMAVPTVALSFEMTVAHVPPAVPGSQTQADGDRRIGASLAMRGANRSRAASR